MSTHGTCGTRECAAKAALENGIQGEMGGGSYTYLTIPGPSFSEWFLFSDPLYFSSRSNCKGNYWREVLGSDRQDDAPNQIFPRIIWEYAISFISLLVARLTIPMPDPYPYADYLKTLRTSQTRNLLHQMEREAIVLLQNNNNVLPLKKTGGSVALIGPQSDRVTVSHLISFFIRKTES